MQTWVLVLAYMLHYVVWLMIQVWEFSETSSCIEILTLILRAAIGLTCIFLQ